MSKSYKVPANKIVFTKLATDVLSLLVKGVPMTSKKLDEKMTELGYSKQVWTALMGSLSDETRNKWNGATNATGYHVGLEGSKELAKKHAGYNGSLISQGIVTAKRDGRQASYTLTDHGAKCLANSIKVKAAREAARKEKDEKKETAQVSS